MTISGFTHPRRIQLILNELGDDTCGTASICSIYEHFRLSHDLKDILRLSRIDGEG